MHGLEIDSIMKANALFPIGSGGIPAISKQEADPGMRVLV
jgi:hypothetical protein